MSRCNRYEVINDRQQVSRQSTVHCRLAAISAICSPVRRGGKWRRRDAMPGLSAYTGLSATTGRIGAPRGARRLATRHCEISRPGPRYDRDRDSPGRPAARGHLEHEEGTVAAGTVSTLRVILSRGTYAGEPGDCRPPGQPLVTGSAETDDYPGGSAHTGTSGAHRCHPIRELVRTTLAKGPA
jgi:hypothetical protein